MCLVQWIKDILEYKPFSDLLIAAIGSFAGALGGFAIVEFNRRRGETDKKIRNINAAISLAVSICSNFIAMKGQLILPIKQNYDEQRIEFIDLVDNASNPTKKLEYKADFSKITPPKISIDLLQSVLIKEVDLVGFSLQITLTLMQVIDGINQAVESRNEFIAFFRSAPFSEMEKAHRYFGVPFPNGEIDRTYYDILTAIYNYNDDAIFFAKLLYEKLIEHGLKIAKANNRNPSVIQTAKLKKNVDSLIPPSDNYKDWVNDSHQNQP